MTAPILTNSTELDVLAQKIQLQLAQQEPSSTALKIRCALRRGKLMVLAEHSSNISFESPLIFLSLKQAIHLLLPEIDPSLPSLIELQRRIALEALPVQLFLRKFGQKQPYAFHRFVWQSKQTTKAMSDGVTSDEAMWDEVMSDEVTSDDRTSGEAMSGEAMAEHSHATESLSSVTADGVEESALKAETGVESTVAENGANPELAEASSSPLWLQWVSRPLQEIPRWMLGGVAGVFALSGIVYGLSGPCVIGPCERLSTAQTLSRSALALLSEHPNPEDVLKANQELEEAITLLNTIPSWSRHHSAAQIDLKTYQRHSQAVELLIQAQQQATLASKQSQNPPHPIQDWVKVRLLWQQAIAWLKQIPADSLIYALGQEKLAEYSENLTVIEARIKAEQMAESTLNAALKTGQLARHRTETADSFPGWQLAYKDWRDAVHSLQRIPQGTMAYAEAQQLLATYRRYSEMAGDRTSQERMAKQIYNQALNSAHQARDFEQQNQWTMAVTHWRNALDQIQKVPSGSTIHADAQTWLAPYQTALSQAEASLRKAIALQKVQQDLNQACGESAAICNYIAAPSSIRVNVASGYDYAIDQSMTPPPLRGNSLINPVVAQQANSLLQTIATVGVNAQMPIELYDAQGRLLARYIPSLAGFVKH